MNAPIDINESILDIELRDAIPREMRPFLIFDKHSGRAMTNRCLCELKAQDIKIAELESIIKELLKQIKEKT